jgi:hypothetical protein
MTEFCHKCKKYFKNKYTLKRHQENSQNCNISGSKTNKINYFPCKNCPKKFTRKDSLRKHIDLGRCGGLKQRNKIKGNNNIPINNNVEGDNNNIQNCIFKNPVTINLMYFGEDGVKNLTYDEINNLMGSDENLVQYLIKAVNLNPKKPQHHNILYTNLSSTYGKSYQNGGWVDKKISELISMLIDAKLVEHPLNLPVIMLLCNIIRDKEDLNDILNEMDFLSKKTKKKIKDTIISLDCDKPGNRKKLASYIRPILYHHREMIEKTKLTKEQEDEIIRKEQEEAELAAAEEEAELAARKKKKSKKTTKKI